MARTFPDGWEALEAAGAIPFEIATLRRLAADLPDDFSVFHGVHWTRLDHGYSVYGEIDFIVVGPQGQVVLIEQKSGLLAETPEGLVKVYPTKRKNVSVQMQRSVNSLQSSFRQGHAGVGMALDYLLYCPDYRVRSPATAGIASERIVDAGKAAQLATRIRAIIEVMPPIATVSAVDKARCRRVQAGRYRRPVVLRPLPIDADALRSARQPFAAPFRRNV